MKCVRLKQDCAFEKMNTDKGLVTKNWKDVNDDFPVFNEMEVEGQEAPVITAAVAIPAPAVEDKKKALPIISGKKK